MVGGACGTSALIGLPFSIGEGNVSWCKSRLLDTLWNHPFVGRVGLNRNVCFGTRFFSRRLRRVSEGAIRVGNGSKMAHCDGRGVKKSSFAMVDRLPTAYVGCGAPTRNPTDDLVLGYNFRRY